MLQYVPPTCHFIQIPFQIKAQGDKKCKKINVNILSHCTDPYENELIFPSKMTNYSRLFNSFFCDTKEHILLRVSPFAFGVIKSILRGFVSRGCAA